MFGFPKKPRDPGLTYQSNLLRSVTIQLNYPPTDQLLINKLAIIEALKTNFPLNENIVSNQIQFTLGPNQKTPIFQLPENKDEGFAVKNVEGSWKISLTKNTLAVNIVGNKYTNFEEVYLKLKETVLTIFEQYGLKLFNRASIRKINFISYALAEGGSPTSALSVVLNEALVSGLLLLPDQGNNVRAMINQVLKKDPYQLNLNYGMIENAKPKVEYGILLDMDLIRSGEIGIELLENEFKGMNEEIFNVFHWAINPNFASLFLR